MLAPIDKKSLRGLEGSKAKYKILSRIAPVGNNFDTLISGSVGRGGVNHKDDVLIIQLLFNLISFIPETGACNDELIDRISGSFSQSAESFRYRRRQPDQMLRGEHLQDC